MRKWIAGVIVGALAVGLTGVAAAADLGIYNGFPNDGWYSHDQSQKDVEQIMAQVKGFNEIVAFTDKELDQLGEWAEKNADDGEFDIIWLPGTMPNVLYPHPNKQPDGSLAERWLDGGNMFINVADWFAYVTYETGGRGPESGAAGAENILDLPGIIRFGDNTKVTITEAGKKYIPSLGDTMITDRPIVGAAIKAPWEIAEIFGEAGTDYDPIVIHNTDTGGYVAFINQGNLSHTIDRAAATIEFINNWVAEQGVLAVRPEGKLTTTWGALKAR